METRIRFGDLVRNSGRPQTLTLWTDPKNDRALAKATKQNRVLTVIQEQGKKDFGRIGFHQQANALYLLFPRPLPSGADTRVVGMNYQLIEEPPVQNPVSPVPLPKMPPRSKPTEEHSARISHTTPP